MVPNDGMTSKLTVKMSNPALIQNKTFNWHIQGPQLDVLTRCSTSLGKLQDNQRATVLANTGSLGKCTLKWHVLHKFTAGINYTMLQHNNSMFFTVLELRSSPGSRSALANARALHSVVSCANCKLCSTLQHLATWPIFAQSSKTRTATKGFDARLKWVNSAAFTSLEIWNYHIITSLLTDTLNIHQGSFDVGGMMMP